MKQLLKFIVQAHLVEVDENHRITGEAPTEPTAIYGVEELKRYAAEFASLLDKLNGQSNSE